MSHCPTCDRDVTPTQEILPGGVLVTACPKCEFPFAKEERTKSAAPKQAPTPVRVVAGANEGVIEQVRARLAYLEVEVERLSALKGEAATLRRMLRAAERK